MITVAFGLGIAGGRMVLVIEDICTFASPGGPGRSARSGSFLARSGSFLANAIVNECWHLAHFARFPSFSRETLKEASRLGHEIESFISHLQ